MLQELYNERFRGRKLLSCLAFPFINHRLTDLLSLQTTPPTFPKGTPGAAQSDSRPSKPRVSVPFTCTGSQCRERSAAGHSMQEGKFFTCRFIQNIHKELRAGTQRAKATPPLLRIGCWLLWRHACRHSNRLSDYYLFFIWPGFELIHLMMWSPLVMEAAAESRPEN